MYLAGGMVSLVLKNPAKAAGLRTRFMQRDDTYSQVFSDSIPLQTWVSIIEILKRVDEGLEIIRTNEERFLWKWRSLVALIVVGRLFKTFVFTSKQLIQLDFDRIDPNSIKEVWLLIQSQRRDKPKAKDYKSPSLVERCTQIASDTYDIALPQVVGQRTIHDNFSSKSLPEDFLNAVDAILPEQPWKPGVHNEIASQLDCRPFKVSQAICQLVDSGRRYRQKDGVVYGSNGEILMVDNNREEIPPI
jgi:hypothetical protein